MKKKTFHKHTSVFILDTSQKLHGCKTTPHVVAAPLRIVSAPLQHYKERFRQFGGQSRITRVRLLLPPACLCRHSALQAPNTPLWRMWIVGYEGEIAVLEHGGGNGCYNRECLHMEIVKHFVRTPPAKKTNAVSVHVSAEQGHGAGGA
jgi:hypothetical protein